MPRARLVALGSLLRWMSLAPVALDVSVMVGLRGAPAAAQSSATTGWNDAQALALVGLATRRRAEQLADTGLVDYHVTARGYVSFLASLGAGYLEAPKLVKTDQLALEVYWQAPNRSKQRIVGRRDTLLLPTDIQYHRDHLGIIQNNFPETIRIGDGDEVRDVPHPLSARGMTLYDYRISDSLTIRTTGRTIHVIEVKVRPKDDREARVVGALYIDPAAGQVVQMAFNFTHAAFLDDQLEDLAVVLENRLVGEKYWLPSRQLIEIRRTGTWLDYPVRGIIKGRWEIGDYTFNTALPPAMFSGPEIIVAPQAELKKYPWQGTIIDSLPPDIRGVVDPDIERVQAEARVLVRAQALERVQSVRLSAPHASDFVRVNRVEGLAAGAGFNLRLNPGTSFVGRGRYGIDDRAGKYLAQLRWESPTGRRVEGFYSRDFAEMGEEPERSTVVNSLAAQEFGSDLADPYGVRALGVRLVGRAFDAEWTAAAAHEWQRALSVHATPATGVFEPLLPAYDGELTRLSIGVDRPLSEWIGPGLLRVRATGSLFVGQKTSLGSSSSTGARVSFGLENRSEHNASTLVIRESIGASHKAFPQEGTYFGGPITLPGYPLHSIGAKYGAATRVELQTPIPLIAVPLGRFGRIPPQARLAPYVAAAAVGDPTFCRALTTCANSVAGVYPAVGVGLLTVFDVLRFDVARGLRHGSWMFNVDVSRDFWSIL